MKKTLLLGLCGMATVLLIAGCTKKTDVTATDSTDKIATDSEATTAPVVKGSVELGEYKGIKVTLESTEVTDEEIESQVTSILEANPDYVEVDRVSQDKDLVNIDYVGKQDGVEFEGGSAEGFDFIIGQTSFIDGFKEGLIGVKKGDKKELNLTFPDPYQNPDLAGKPAVFEVTVNSVEEPKEAVMNDAFVQRMSDFQTVEEFKNDIKAEIKTQKEEQADAKKQNDILMAVIENAKFTGIDGQVEAEFNSQMEQMTNTAAMYGMKLSDYAAMYGTDEAGYKDMVRTQVENGVKLELICDAVAQIENIKVEDADRESLAAVNNAANAEELVQNFGQETVDKYAAQMKVIQFLEDNAVIE